MLKRKYIAVIITTAVILTSAWTFFGVTQREKIRAEIAKFYELAIPGASAQVIALEEESGIYKTVVKIFIAGQISYREAFVTKDGKIITESVIYMKRSAEEIAKMKAFVDCLFDKEVRVYGILNATTSPEGAQATALQLNLLGRYSPKLYVSCDGPNLQGCIDAGITKVPSVAIGNKIEPGVKTIDWFEQQTGCRY